ncbi:glutaminase [Ascidiimonas sp. W6]|uniref:glutaminase n=1 Tax=Ascidiimonas meishanensis TaxID=3128903 RepID=UPI0030EE3829
MINKVDFQQVLDRIQQKAFTTKNRGQVATYIPELKTVDLNKFGIHLRTNSNQQFNVGDAFEKFSIQSISKVLTLAQASRILGADILERVDVEPSGNPFNFLSLLELEKGIPRNPFINAGALVISDMLVSQFEDPKKAFLQYVRELTDDEDIHYDEAVAASEKATGYRNYAAANLLKSFNNLHNDVEKVLDFYFYQCSLAMSCEQLTKAFYIFTHGGKCTRNKTFLTLGQVKRINALMITCGFYDEAGEFAFEVGLPGKSGVGGGIVAVLPGMYSIAAWSPGLNAKGNSTLGMQALERFTTLTGLSIF